MKTTTARNAALALTGLGALTIYILACTSFSPDDTKILYPAFEPGGLIGMAVYDRETKRSEMAFVPVSYEEKDTNLVVTPRLLRGQWLPDGRRIVVAWSEKEEDRLSVATVPVGGRGAFKVFTLPALKEAAMQLVLPLCVSGERLLLHAGQHHLVRLDLKTGAIEHRELETTEGELSLYPTPSGEGAFYVEHRGGTNESAVFGRVDPDQLTRKPLVTITNKLLEGSFFTYDARGSRVAFVEEDAEDDRVVVLKDGKPTFSRPLGQKERRLKFGSGILSPKGDLIWAGFQRQNADQKTVAYGLMEIPLSEAPIRETTLIAEAESSDEMNALYFQVGVSHDGKTAAVSSTFLAAAEEKFKAGDCALFLVDLTDAKRKVTKVPIPLPPVRQNPAGK